MNTSSLQDFRTMTRRQDVRLQNNIMFTSLVNMIPNHFEMGREHECAISEYLKVYTTPDNKLRSPLYQSSQSLYPSSIYAHHYSTNASLSQSLWYCQYMSQAIVHADHFTSTAISHPPLYAYSSTIQQASLNVNRIRTHLMHYFAIYLSIRMTCYSLWTVYYIIQV